MNKFILTKHYFVTVTVTVVIDYVDRRSCRQVSVVISSLCQDHSDNGRFFLQEDIDLKCA